MRSSTAAEAQTGDSATTTIPNSHLFDNLERISFSYLPVVASTIVLDASIDRFDIVVRVRTRSNGLESIFLFASVLVTERRWRPVIKVTDARMILGAKQRLVKNHDCARQGVTETR
jgi:hypothetical protein